ncbi:hypothetical protein MVLG_04593 [Microbotryum lychnidis-dioicae p1A1 Lamole]|uniref:YCII-related domain-containing protein n=1 Tax=Microbotryum lychnidis-dioicae (strain p1A1 Lamole / MvSl-1064) TaxID=683840 RepID=U5HBP6_USTV1|nr:hypothetical protein MVLG_04593 [Microbotryum lychnidis-dioicae p1A1 Lamole]|eukprot:KDE05051.1 hypothetical protein MVLG_04593 [Microbotryum lychnidis-dioicae p1A1 Lamole]
MSDATVKNVAWAEKPSKPLDQYNNYLCILPDFVEGLSVRASHLEHAAEGHKNGWIKEGGATFEGAVGSKMTGSFLLLREESKEKALERLSKDIYATAGAWDMSKATITAVAVAKH